MTHHKGQTRPTFFAARAALLVAAAASVFTACGSILDVDNPNSAPSEALDNPSAAASIVVGAENSTARAVSSALTPYTAATDEAIWVGSRDAYGQLDNGGIGDPNNEYPDAAFFNVGEARWLAEQTIAKLEGFVKDGKLSYVSYWSGLTSTARSSTTRSPTFGTTRRFPTDRLRARMLASRTCRFCTIRRRHGSIARPPSTRAARCSQCELAPSLPRPSGRSSTRRGRRRLTRSSTMRAQQRTRPRHSRKWRETFSTLSRPRTRTSGTDPGVLRVRVQ